MFLAVLERNLLSGHLWMRILLAIISSEDQGQDLLLCLIMHLFFDFPRNNHLWRQVLLEVNLWL